MWPTTALELSSLRLGGQVAWMFLPWLFALAAAGLVGFGLDALASRRAQGGRARTVINPYVTGRPLRDSRLVFGRDTIIRDVRRGLSEGESFYLTGERRIGKTTILLQVGELHRRAGGTSVFVDVAGSVGDQAQVVLQRALVQANRAQGLDDGGDAMTLARRLRERGELALMVDEVDSLNGADLPTRRLFRAMCLEADAPARMVAAGVGPGRPARRGGAALGAADPHDPGGAPCRRTPPGPCSPSPWPGP
jgi:hypothetical protein